MLKSRSLEVARQSLSGLSVCLSSDDDVRNTHTRATVQHATLHARAAEVLLMTHAPRASARVAHRRSVYSAR